MASSLKRGGEPDIDKPLGSFQRNHAFPNGKDIGIVMLTGQPCRIITPSYRTSDPLHFICGDGLAVTRTAYDNSLLGFTATFSAAGMHQSG